MRVLFADKLPDDARTRLAAIGCEVRAEPALKDEALATRIGEFEPDVLVVRSTKVQQAQLEASSNLSLVVRAGAGVNTIDLALASASGVYVANCPGKNSVAVAELVIGLMIAIDRRIPDNVADLRAGQWNKGKYAKALGLKGRTLGLLGFGGIGQAVARRANAMGMQVLCWSRSLTEAEAASHGVRRMDTPEQVARRAHVLSVHLPMNPSTRGLVGESILGSLPPGAMFINTARAGVVDDAALLAALERGVYAGLDVFTDEPNAKSAAFQHTVASHRNVYGTHHIGASTEQAQDAVASEACRIVESYVATGRVANCVNLAEKTSADHCVVVRHRDRVGVLAAVLEGLREAGINVQEMENTIFAGGGAATARIAVHGLPPEAALDQMRSHEHVLQVSVVSIAIK